MYVLRTSGLRSRRGREILQEGNQRFSTGYRPEIQFTRDVPMRPSFAASG